MSEILQEEERRHAIETGKEMEVENASSKYPMLGTLPDSRREKCGNAGNAEGAEKCVRDRREP